MGKHSLHNSRGASSNFALDPHQRLSLVDQAVDGHLTNNGQVTPLYVVGFRNWYALAQ